jgi:hypothetical protein
LGLLPITFVLACLSRINKWALVFYIPFLAGPLLILALLSLLTRHQQYTPGFLLRAAVSMAVVSLITSAIAIVANDGQAGMYYFFVCALQWIGVIASIGVGIGMRNDPDRADSEVN